MPEVPISAVEELRKGDSLPLLSGFLWGPQEVQLKTEASADVSRSDAPMMCVFILHGATFTAGPLQDSPLLPSTLTQWGLGQGWGVR